MLYIFIFYSYLNLYLENHVDEFILYLKPKLIYTLTWKKKEKREERRMIRYIYLSTFTEWHWLFKFRDEILIYSRALVCFTRFLLCDADFPIASRDSISHRSSRVNEPYGVRVINCIEGPFLIRIL